MYTLLCAYNARKQEMNSRVGMKTIIVRIPDRMFWPFSATASLYFGEFVEEPRKSRAVTYFDGNVDWNNSSLADTWILCPRVRVVLYECIWYIPGASWKFIMPINARRIHAASSSLYPWRIYFKFTRTYREMYVCEPRHISSRVRELIHGIDNGQLL